MLLLLCLSAEPSFFYFFYVLSLPSSRHTDVLERRHDLCLTLIVLEGNCNCGWHWWWLVYNTSGSGLSVSMCVCVCTGGGPPASPVPK